MNREIKFRAWDKERKVMITSPNRLSVTYVDGLLTVFDHNQSGKQIYCELMQYTGLKDKNGKEIYEGDVVERVSQHRWIAEWSHQCAGFSLKSTEGYLWAEPYVIEGCELIGNIYENPELLPSSEAGD